MWLPSGFLSVTLAGGFFFSLWICYDHNVVSHLWFPSHASVRLLASSAVMCV